MIGPEHTGHAQLALEGMLHVMIMRVDVLKIAVASSKPGSEPSENVRDEFDISPRKHCAIIGLHLFFNQRWLAGVDHFAHSRNNALTCGAMHAFFALQTGRSGRSSDSYLRACIVFGGVGHAVVNWAAPCAVRGRNAAGFP